MSTMKLPQSLVLALCVFFFISSCCITTSAQSSQAPGPAGPTNITAILQKAGQFTTLLRLLKSTQLGDQINTQLNNSNQGMTVFAPTDNSFASLKAGTLNSLTDQQKVQLLQFHVIPSFLSVTQFQTVSNPLRTQAGDSNNGQFPLNVTTSGNQVNITTGVNTATIDNTIYSDGQLAVYQLSQVLLPLDLFGSPSPSPAPAEAPEESKPKKAVTSKAPTAASDNASADASGAGRVEDHAVSAVLMAAVVAFWLKL